MFCSLMLMRTGESRYLIKIIVQTPQRLDQNNADIDAVRNRVVIVDRDIDVSTIWSFRYIFDAK